ncbi:hypothetical protein AGOR_G00194850 [Albula goreensis]|uniref:Ig-like domain-containing protein n=1 Tax=Albula goreensis TaxID=1534307 RepID=A0A8T3CVS8_9TELE|nr:hypothetical protein AGOR_G00194850 [Albula goreensis]
MDCIPVWVFLLCLTAVSVSSAQPVELNLRVGDTVTFPTAVHNEGSLMHAGKLYNLTVYISVTTPHISVSGNKVHPTLVCTVDGGTQVTLSFYREGKTHHLVNSAPSLKLSQPVTENGTYTCEAKNPISTEKTSITVGNHWTVHVSAPHISVIRNEYPCSLLCTVERGTQVTLAWYRKGEEESFVSSLVSNTPHVYLPQTVYESGTYTCEAVNSVSRERSSVTVGKKCAVNVRSCSDSWIIGLIVIGMFIIIGAILASVGIMACINPKFNEGLRRLLGGEEDTLEVNNGE